MKAYKAGLFKGFAFTGILALLCLALQGCNEGEPEDTAVAVASIPPSATSTAEGIPAESAEAGHRLQVVVVEDIKKMIAQAGVDGRVLVIDFWATWCVPCVEMFPSLHEGLVARGDAVRAVTVTLDDPSREVAAIAFLRKHDALHDAYIIQNDSAAQQALADELGEKWNTLAVPAILVYDQGGNLVGEFLEGGSTSAILEQVDRLLASGQDE